MKAWQRGAATIGLAIVLASIDARVARPQEDDKAGPAEPAAGSGSEPGAAEAPSDEEDAGVATPPDAQISASAAPTDPAARKAWLATEAAAVLHRHAELAHARVGVAFVDVATGALVWGQDEGGKFNLASCTKVLTSSAALARLGPGFHWRTAIFAESLDLATGVVAGDLYVRGHGDPTLDDDALRDLATDVRRAGVKKVTGALVIDDSYFDDAVDPPHYDDKPKEQSGYRAAVSAFGVDDNAITVVIEPDPAGSAPGAIHLVPDTGDYARVREGNVLTVTKGRGRVRVDVKQAPGGDHLELTVTGQVRADGGLDTTRRRVADPTRMAGEAMRTALVAQGIAIGKKVKRGEIPADAREVAAHESKPLADVVRDMNKFSNNFYAESLLKTMGAEAKQPPPPPPLRPGSTVGIAAPPRVHAPGTPAGPLAGPPGPRASWADGLAVVHDFLVHDVGLADGSFRVDNGSGLYAATDVSPQALAQVVAHASADFRYGPDLIASFAVAGVDGTLRKRLAGTPGAGRVRAKTGTLDAVSTLGGLVAVDGRRPLAFAILVNDIPPSVRGKARALEDELLGVALGYLGP